MQTAVAENAVLVCHFEEPQATRNLVKRPLLNARFLAAPEGTAAASRKTPFAVIPTKAGIQPWTPAYAGVTAGRLFIRFGGPQPMRTSK